MRVISIHSASLDGVFFYEGQQRERDLNDDECATEIPPHASERSLVSSFIFGDSVRKSAEQVVLYLILFQSSPFSSGHWLRESGLK